jgi:hypothetical protein
MLINLRSCNFIHKFCAAVLRLLSHASGMMPDSSIGQLRTGEEEST